MPYESPDATADFARDLSDPSKWIVRPGVPLFKEHVRKDPATGATITVDRPKLFRIAANMQRLERLGGVPVRGTLGHTEPGKPETQQPPVALWYRNARVQPFGPQGELAVVGDEWLDPQYAKDRKNYPYRSAEYYDDTEQITGVALLTRDPFLDLGVVAYSKAAPGPVRYSANGRAPYLYLLGDSPMPQPNQAPQDPNGQPQTTPTHYVPTPPVPQTTPTHYGAPYNPGYAPPAAPYGYNPPPSNRPPNPYGSGPDTHTHVPASQHQHPGEWNLGGVAYAFPPPDDEGPPKPPGAGGPPGMPPAAPPAGPQIQQPQPGGEHDLQMMHHHMTQAAACMAKYLAQRGPSRYEPTDSPFPPEQQMQPPQGPPGTAADPYARNPQPAPRGYYGQPNPPTPYGQPAPQPVPYAAPQPQYAAPAQPQQPARTISGLPVGYQTELDRLTYQLNEQDRAMKVLLYERDQADTEACASEIRRLAQAGYQVGEYEFTELKNKRRDQRGAYLQHIATKYSHIGTEALPPMSGDPTAQLFPQQMENRPATQEEMEAALKLKAQNPRLDYAAALNYARQGHAAPTQYGMPGEGFDPYAQAFDPRTVTGPEPSMNGHG